MYYEDIFYEFNKERIRYLVCGGIALNLHGIPRMTADLDLMVDMEEKNLLKLLKILKGLGYKPKAPVKINDFLDINRRKLWRKKKNMLMFTLYNIKKPYQELDMFTENPLNFDEAYKRRKVIRAASLEIPTVCIEDLIEMKKRGRRKQDRTDVESLRKLKKILKG